MATAHRTECRTLLRFTVNGSRFTSSSVSPSLQPPRIVRPIEKQRHLTSKAFAVPVVAAVAVVPPVAGEALGADGARDGNAVAAPRHLARHVAITLHLYRFRWIER